MLAFHRSSSFVDTGSDGLNVHICKLAACVYLVVASYSQGFPARFDQLVNIDLFMRWTYGSKYLSSSNLFLIYNI